LHGWFLRAIRGHWPERFFTPWIRPTNVRRCGGVLFIAPNSDSPPTEW